MPRGSCLIGSIKPPFALATMPFLRTAPPTGVWVASTSACSFCLPTAAAVSAGSMNSPLDAQIGTESLVRVPGPRIAPPCSNDLAPRCEAGTSLAAPSLWTGKPRPGAFGAGMCLRVGC
ncbi:hypothetical protein D3C71_1632140 [compost metagenome]